jgi:hypothetical protein
MLTTMSMSTLESTVPIWILDTMNAEKWELGNAYGLIYFRKENIHSFVCPFRCIFQSIKAWVLYGRVRWIVRVH